MPYNTLASDASLAVTQKALESHGFTVLVTEDAKAAKATVLGLIPQGAEVMNMTSITLDTISVSTAVNEPGYNSVRNKLTSMKRETQGDEMQKLGAAPDWTVGSVHAVTEDGSVMIASQTGSQLSAYAYGANHVVWVVGTHKIVKNMDEGFKRLTERSLPLEAKRARVAYNIPADKPGSAINKVLIVHTEVKPQRITIVFVKEVLGF